MSAPAPDAKQITEAVIKELAVTHGLKISRKDPVLAFVPIFKAVSDQTLHQFETSVKRAVEALEASAKRHDEDLKQKAERTLGEVVRASETHVLNTNQSTKDEIRGIIANFTESISKDLVTSMSDHLSQQFDAGIQDTLTRIEMQVTRFRAAVLMLLAAIAGLTGVIGFALFFRH